MKERIKQIRKSMCLTQEQFAKRIGITGSALSLIESGKSKPSKQTTFLICREFGVNEEWLQTGKGDMFLTMTTCEEIAAFAGDVCAMEDDSFKKCFVAMLARLDDKGWMALENVVNLIGEVKK